LERRNVDWECFWLPISFRVQPQNFNRDQVVQMRPFT
jgi:hypothetical protein